MTRFKYGWCRRCFVQKVSDEPSEMSIDDQRTVSLIRLQGIFSVEIGTVKKVKRSSCVRYREKKLLTLNFKPL